jgi:hypothetical protein
MRGIGGEGLEGLFGHSNDHGSLRQGLGSIPLASRTLERDGAIDGDGERHKKKNMVEEMGGGEEMG